MICGKGAKPAASQCKVSAGDSVKLQFGHNSPADDFIDPSHVGPCNVYLAPSKAGAAAPNKGWFKIYQGVWDSKNKWCLDKLRGQKGLLTVPIPKNLKSGSYVLRSEFNALHEANQKGKAQFYIFCIDIAVTGSGNVMPSGSDTVSIPGHLKADTPGVLFDVYSKGKPQDAGDKYPTIGPKVSQLFTTGGSSSSAPAQQSGGGGKSDPKDKKAKKNQKNKRSLRRSLKKVIVTQH